MRRDRQVAYKRAFNYGSGDMPAGAVVNRSFHRQLVHGNLASEYNNEIRVWLEELD